MRGPGGGAHRRAVWAGGVSLALALGLFPGTAGGAEAGAGSPPPRAARAAPILIGPCRVTLVDGKTLEGIAVFRERERVRLVLEDGTEIEFEPSRVESVRALADLEAEREAEGERLGQPAAGPSGAKPPPAATRPLERGGADASRPASESDAMSESEKEIQELAAMLAAAVRHADLEQAARHGGEGEDDAERGLAQDLARPAGTEGPGERSSMHGAESGFAGGEARVTPAERPRPEEFDATRPVVMPGLRWIGADRPSWVPSTPPPTDFPRTPRPTVSLGPSVWRPSSGFRTSVRWANPLPPATSFTNQLSGLGPPATGLRPTWWYPTPVQWPQSTFPDTWRPRDGFEKSQESRRPSAPGQ